MTDDIDIEDYDIILYKTISLKELLYKSDMIIEFYGSSWTIKNFEPLKNNLELKIKNFGIPVSYNNDDRGDIIVKFNVENDDLDKMKSIII